MAGALRTDVRRLFERRFTAVALLGLLVFPSLFQLGLNQRVTPVVIDPASSDQAKCLADGGPAYRCVSPRPELSDVGMLTRKTGATIAVLVAAVLLLDERSALGVWHSLGYWSVVLTVLITVTWLVFRRRDVTRGTGTQRVG